MSEQFYDFDAAFEEEDDEPVILHNLLGQDWKCKRRSEVSAAFLLRLDRLMLAQATGATELPGDFVVDDDLSSESILRTLAGDDNVDAWLRGVEQPDGTTKCLPYNRLAKVAAYLNAVYRGLDPDQGEAQAANRAQRRAAAKGKGSRGRKS